MGCHRKSKHTQISRRLTTVAVPALAGVTAALCFAPQAQASQLATHVVTEHAAVMDMAGRVGGSSEVLTASQHAAPSTTARTVKYTVRPGDTLSAIAGRVYHDERAWPVIYWANHSKIQFANDIAVGQVLEIPAKPARIPNAPGELGITASPAVVSAPEAASPVYQAAPATATSTSTYSGGGGFTSCVIARESGGNSQVMNSSGHYGLYQFSASTWSAYGGSSSDFGNASVAEQNKVFNNALAAGGQSNWSAYDGC
ncbi:MAG: transglycosylase family protein [Actinomycetota bacterium]|nr:transglycosylase family protein [Actinomycetota bacterium]